MPGDTLEEAAPRERVFDLARSIDLHQRSTERTREQAVGGRTSGLIGVDESVTWRAVFWVSAGLMLVLAAWLAKALPRSHQPKGSGTQRMGNRRRRPPRRRVAAR